MAIRAGSAVVSEAPKSSPGRRRDRKSRQCKAAMRAITVLPGIACSARLEEVAEPAESDGPVLVRTLALGVCGTDREILNGSYGFAPPGQQRLVLGHESLGVVETAPDGCGLVPGDLVVGVVRRPDPEPCVACAAGEWDMCRNGRYTERGIKERHATAPNASASSRNARSKSILNWGFSARCWSPPAFSRRPGTTSSASDTGRARGSQRYCSPPARVPSACLPP